MGLLYANNNKIYCNDYIEIYIPKSYFEDKIAVNEGASIETFGLLFTKSFPGGNEGPIKLFNIPTIIRLMVYESNVETIKVHGRSIDVIALQYMKDSYVMHQTIQKGREVAELFLATMLSGKLPNTLNYSKIIDIWWRNLEISGVTFKVPSKMYEMIIAAIYRDKGNPNKRYGQVYGSQTNPSDYDYDANNVRSVVKNLSTFSGIAFEDISNMISNGINNSIDGIEEQESPLEKIIHY